MNKPNKETTKQIISNNFFNITVTFFTQKDNHIADTLYRIISQIYFLFIGCSGLYLLYIFHNMFLLYYVIIIGFLFGLPYYKIYKNFGRSYLISLSYFSTTISLLLFLVGIWFSMPIVFNPGGHRTIIFSVLFSIIVTSIIIFVSSALWVSFFTLLTEDIKKIRVFVLHLAKYS